jgi:hypothetical protein
MAAEPPGAPSPLGRVLLALTLAPARHPRAILALVAAVTILLAAMVPRVRLDSSMETIFHAQDPEVAVYERFKETFGEDEIMVVALRVREGDVFTRPSLERIRRVTDAIAALGAEWGVDRVFSLTSVDDTRAIEGGFEVLRLVGRTIPDDPAALRAIREQAFRNPLFVRNLVSEDGRAAAINVWLEHRPGDKYGKERLFERVREIVEPERSADVEVHYAGIPILTAYTSEYLRRDLLVFVPLTVLLIAATLFVQFRSLAGVVLPLVTVGLACVWMAGIIGLLGRTVSIISSAVPSLVLACGSAEVIHVMGEYYRHDADDPARLEKMLRHIFGAVWIAGATTVAGFGAMLVYDIPQVFDFGLYAAIGILSEVTLAAFFVPAALALWRPRPVVLESEAATGLHRRALLAIARTVMDHPRKTIALGALSVALGVWGCARIHVDTDYASYFKPGSPPVRALLFMRENLSGERPINVVVRVRDPAGEGAALEPDLLRRVEALERHMRENPLVKATLSAAGYLRNLNRSMHDDDESARVLPGTRALASQYLDLYGRPGELRRYVSHDRSALNVIGRSSIISSEEFLACMDDLRAFAARTFPPEVDVTITGSMYLLSKSSIGLARDQAASFGWADVLVFSMMLLLFRSFKVAALSIVPNVIPILWCYGIMGWVGIPLSTGTSVIAAMSLGIIVDDTIHILARYQHMRYQGASPRAAVTEVFIACGKPVVYTCVTNLFGFSILMLSSFAPLVHLGWLTAATMVTALAADLVLQPALLVLFDRRGFRYSRRFTPDPDGLDERDARRAEERISGEREGASP